MNRLKTVRVVLTASLLSFALCSTNVSAATYKVVKNDTLYKISKLFRTSVTTVKNTNSLTSSSLSIGQKLTISAKIYTVKKGDTLNKIATSNKITLANLRKANNKYTNSLKIGQKLILPGIKPASSTASKTTVMAAKTTAAKTAVISYTKEEKDLLARLITAEATGQPYDAMVAIGGVVINRVQSKDWPDNINDVIYDVPGGYYQFTPVKNGYINKPASATAIKAAGEALTGTDPSKGAIYYFDNSSTNEWLWAKPITAKYGKMVFAK